MARPYARILGAHLAGTSGNPYESAVSYPFAVNLSSRLQHSTKHACNSGASGEEAIKKTTQRLSFRTQRIAARKSIYAC